MERPVSSSSCRWLLLFFSSFVEREVYAGTRMFETRGMLHDRVLVQIRLKFEKIAGLFLDGGEKSIRMCGSVETLSCQGMFERVFGGFWFC